MSPQRNNDVFENLEELGALSHNELQALSVEARLDFFHELSWSSRNTGAENDDIGLAFHKKLDSQLKRLLHSLPSSAFTSPEFMDAAQKLAQEISNFLQNEQIDLDNWANIPVATRLEFLQRIHDKQADLLGIPISSVEYNPGFMEQDPRLIEISGINKIHRAQSITYDFIDGEIPYGDYGAYDRIIVNARPNFGPRHTAREDLETTLLLGLRKLSFMFLSGRASAPDNASSQHKNLIQSLVADAAWRYTPSQFDEYETALRMPGTIASINFINTCFGGKSPIFIPLEKMSSAAAPLIAEHTYCFVEARRGYINYFKSKLEVGGQSAIENLDISLRRQIMREFYRDARDEIVSRSENKTWSSPATDAISKVFEAIPLRDEYDHHFKESARNMVRVLKKDIIFQLAKQAWIIMPNILRRYTVRRMARIQDREFSHPSFRFAPTPKFTFKDLGAGLGGTQDSYTREIKINTRPSEGWRTFTCATNTSLHEKTHDYQVQIVRALEDGKLPEGSPFYEQAKDFEDFFTPEGKGERMYIQPYQGLSAYRAHPIERQAREVSETITGLFGNGLIEKVMGDIKEWKQKRLRKRMASKFAGMNFDE